MRRIKRNEEKKARKAHSGKLTSILKRRWASCSFFKLIISLFIHSLIIGGVILGILKGIFLICPQKAFFSADIEMETLNEIKGEISRVDIDAEELSFFTEEKLHFDTDLIIINGVNYVCKKDEDPEIIITPNIPNTNGNINIKIQSLPSSQDINFLSTIGNQDSIKDATKPNPPSVLLRAKEEVLKSQKPQLNIETDAAVVISTKQECSVAINNSVVIVNGIVKETSDIENENNGKSNWMWDEETIEISFPEGIKKLSWVTNKDKNYYFYNSHVNTIDISKINALKDLRGNGNISVSYNPTPEEYPIKKQDLEIISEDKKIVANITSLENDRYLISAAGYADSIELSKNSLIPSLMNWFKGNLYMIPTTIVTIIGGAISLINNKYGKKEKKEQGASKDTLNKKEELMG